MPPARRCSTRPDGFLPVNRVAVNAGITKVVVGAQGTTLVSFNEHGHLEQGRPITGDLPLAGQAAGTARYRARSSCLRTLPDGFLGSSSTKSIDRGSL